MIDRVLAHYRVTEKLGEGGMGEVWKAVDTTLDREVAIKILPEAFAEDPDRLARFEREAKLLASLNHPNIASVYGLHEADGVRFIAMEFVEGQDLAARLKQGPLPVDDALDIGRRIAMALEVAHGQGVIHRDLKPANVVVLPNGQVKVLDFGLAKAFTPDAASDGSPTFTATVTSAGTRAGVILGTAAYMSPEQARGKPLDKRTDIWSFGCVLYECLTGESPFAGETVSDSIGAILHKDVDWSKLPEAVPPTVRLMLRRCLARDASQRVHDIADARIELDPAQRDASASVVGLATEAETRSAQSRRGLKPWTIAVGVVLGLAAGAMLATSLRPAPEPAPLRKLDLGVTIEPGAETAEAAVSPSGDQVVFTQSTGLGVQALDEFEPRLLEGTEGAIAPVWSPDGSEIAYLSGSKLWKISATGGRPVALCDLGGPATGGYGLHWGAADRIVYSRGDTGVMEVSSRGGDPREIVPANEDESDLHEPFVLPDEQGLLFVGHPAAKSPGILYAFADGERSQIFAAGDGERVYRPVYDPAGFVLFTRQNGNATEGVWALPFSASSLEATGEAFLVAPGADSATVSGDGTLVVVHGNRVQNADRQLAWVDRQGRQIDVIGGRRIVADPSLSPDGRRLAFILSDVETGNLDLWVRELDRGAETRLTFEPTFEVAPTWSADGAYLYFLAFRPGMTVADVQTLRVPADGSKAPEPLTRGFTTGVAPDGSLIVLQFVVEDESVALNPDLLRRMVRVPIDGSEESILVERPQKLGAGSVSPDGKFLLYGSEVSGRWEVYLTRYPDGTGRWQVSNDGGDDPRWDPRGDRVYFLHDGVLNEVPVDLAGAVPQLGAPSPLFAYPNPVEDAQEYDVSADGSSFVVTAAADTDLEAARRISVKVITNWRREFD